MFQKEEATTVLHIQGERFHLERNKIYLVGRKREDVLGLDIALSDETLDEKHCIIEVEENFVNIIDLHSKMGSYINGKQIAVMIKERMYADAVLHLGTLEGKLQIKTLDEDSSGFHDDHKDMSNTSVNIEKSSEIQFVMPKAPAASAASKAKKNASFNLLNISTGANRTSDSFLIPETQQRASKTLNDTSISESDKSTDAFRDEDDSFIPDTQQIEGPQEVQVVKLQQQFIRDNVEIDKVLPEKIFSDNKSECSQFRICTQEFNEDLFSDENEMESKDLLQPLNTSLEIPKIQLDPVIIDGAEFIPQECSNEKATSPHDQMATKDTNDAEVEMATLNWSASTSKYTLNETDRNNACTPDLFDLPFLAQENAKELNVGSNKAVVTNTEIPTSAVDDGIDKEDDIDLMPTQAFVPKPKKIEEPYAVEVPLTLSGKENLQPSSYGLNVTETLAKTQAFKLNEDSACKIASSNSSDTRNSHDSLLAPTQVLPSINCASKAEQNKASTCPKERLNSTLLGGVEGQKSIKTAASFFADIEDTTPTKKVGQDKQLPKKMKTKQRNLKPSVANSKSTQSSSPSSVSSTLKLDSDVEMQMCTPQFIKDQFQQLVENQEGISFSSRQKSLFTDSSDDEKDVLIALKVPKISTDFDTLLPHLKKTEEDSLQSFPKKRDKEINGNMGRSDVNIKTEPKSRDERHAARDRERLKNESIERNMEQTKEVPKRHKKVVAIKKEDTTKEEKAEMPTRRITRLKSQEQQNANNNGKDTSKRNPHTKQTASNSTTSDVVEKRMTRSRSTTESQESIKTSLSSDKKKIERKRKVSTNASVDQKRLRRSTISGEETKLITIKETKPIEKLKSNTKAKSTQVCISTIDPEHLQNLMANSSGLWTIVTDPMQSDVLVMDKANRTFKFLIAVAKGIPIVSSKWLECFNKTKHQPKISKYLLSDTEFEKRHKFKLVESLDTARKEKIFNGFNFLMTPGILPAPTEMKAIVVCAGGNVYSDSPPPNECKQLYLISTKADNKYWHRFRRNNKSIRIVSAEGILASLMRQNVSPLNEYSLL